MKRTAVGVVHTELSPVTEEMRKNREMPSVTMHMGAVVLPDDIAQAIAARERMESISLTSLKREAYERALEELRQDLIEARDGDLVLDDVWVTESLQQINEAFDAPERYLGRERARR